VVSRVGMYDLDTKKFCVFPGKGSAIPGLVSPQPFTIPTAPSVLHTLQDRTEIN
jgi:hypothetical protein